MSLVARPGPVLWVDADACPRDAKELVYRAAERLKFRTVLVANASMQVPRSSQISLLVVKAGLDVADDRIVQEALRGDVAITADVPLAARLVEKRVTVIDPRGEPFDDDNVSERLALRNLLQEAREAGVQTGGPKPYDARDKARFANALDRLLQAALRGA